MSFEDRAVRVSRLGAFSSRELEGREHIPVASRSAVAELFSVMSLCRTWRVNGPL